MHRISPKLRPPFLRPHRIPCRHRANFYPPLPLRVQLVLRHQTIRHLMTLCVPKALHRRLLAKKRRILFKENLDKNITKCVKFYSAHDAPYGKSQNLYEKAMKMFIRECGIDHPRYQLSWKPLYNWLNRMVAEWRDEGRSNELTSANVESNSSFEKEKGPKSWDSKCGFRCRCDSDANSGTTAIDSTDSHEGRRGGQE